MSTGGTAKTLAGRRVLVVEDDFMLCQMIIVMLESFACVALGPVGTVDDALDFIAQSADSIDAAIVDVNLHGQMSYPVADALLQRNIPFFFATGYDAQDLELRYQNHHRIQKPYQRDALFAALI